MMTKIRIVFNDGRPPMVGTLVGKSVDVVMIKDDVDGQNHAFHINVIEEVTPA